MSVDPGTLGAAGITPPAPGPQIQYREPDDYQELRSRAAQFDQLSATLSPYIDDIRPIIEDEETRNFIRSARETLKQQQELRKPQIDPGLAQIRDEFRSVLEPVVGYVNSERTAKEQAATDSKNAALAANTAYAQRLAAERPDLAEDDYAGIGMLAAYAQHRGISLEEAWNRKGGSLSAPVKRATPPTSLRGDAAAPGVPGESRNERITGPKDLRSRLAANLRAGGMKG